MSFQGILASKNLAEFLVEARRTHSRRTAFTYRPTFRAFTWTYEDLWRHATMFANTLRERDVRKGDRVILMAYNSPYWVAAFFGIQLRGALCVPLSPNSTEDFIQKIIAQTNSKLIFQNRISFFKNIQTPSLTIENITKPSTESNVEIPQISQDDVAEIVYTSGTTGDPKGVVLTHQNILSNFKASRRVIPVDHTMNFVSILPLFHMFEQIGGMLIPLSAGSQISYPASLNPNHLKWIFQDDQITRMLAVPEFLRLVCLRIKERAKEQGKLSQLENLLRFCHRIPIMSIRRFLFRKLHQKLGWRMHTIVSGGAPLEKETGEFFEGIGIYILQGYGLTETSPVLTTNRYSTRKLDSVGKPLPGVTIKFAEDGEILAKGPNIFSGYWNNKEKTKEVFTKDGWFQTGDIGFFDTDGRLHVKGRKKFMIVLPSGEKAHAEDVEAELNKETGIIDSAVIGLKIQKGEQIHAVLLLDDKGVIPQHVVDNANLRLNSYQQIKSFSVWQEADFPRTPTRKIRKSEVTKTVEAELAGIASTPGNNSPLSRLERVIAQVLEVRPQEITDEKRLVADLNLDSLRRIELVARIEQEYSILVDESEITPQTTVQQLKTMLAERKQVELRYPFNPRPFNKCISLIRSVIQPLLFTPALAIFAPAEILGRKNLKNLTHPVLFFSNHLSTADAPVIYGTLPARLRRKLAAAAATDATYENSVWWVKLSRPFLEILFPIFPFVRYGAQTKASFEYTGRIVDRGYSILLFPEGKTSNTGELLPLKQGAGLLGIEMGIPIVPIKLEGLEKVIPMHETPTFRMPKRHKIKITYGKPFLVDRSLTYREATAFIEERIKEL